MAFRICFDPEAWDQYQYWLSQERKTLDRVNALISACRREPFRGIGKPEPLRGELSGFWSRRIDDTHRLVYRVVDNELQVLACRYHYGVR